MRMELPADSQFIDGARLWFSLIVNLWTPDRFTAGKWLHSRNARKDAEYIGAADDLTVSVRVYIYYIASKQSENYVRDRYNVIVPWCLHYFRHRRLIAWRASRKYIRILSFNLFCILFFAFLLPVWRCLNNFSRICARYMKPTLIVPLEIADVELEYTLAI